MGFDEVAQLRAARREYGSVGQGVRLLSLEVLLLLWLLQLLVLLLRMRWLLLLLRLLVLLWQT